MSRIATVRRERERRDEQKRHDHWFANHVATRTTFTAPDGRTIDTLRWSKPGSSIYRVDYLARDGFLFIAGDLGEATHEAYGKDGLPTLDWWGSVSHINYFAKKCQASPKGRGFLTWDRDEAAAEMRRSLAQDYPPAIRREFRDLDGWEALESRVSWDAWLHDNGYDVFGDEWYDWAPRVGDVIDARCRAHLEGLRRALAQLAAAVPSVPTTPAEATR